MHFKTYFAVLWLWMALAVLVFFVLLKIPAPYGRAVRSGWGRRISSRAGWFVMELPAAALFAAFFLYYRTAGYDPNHLLVSVIFLVLWEAHYVHRAVVYPMLIPAKRARMTLSVVLMAILFNTINACLQTTYLYRVGPHLTTAWLGDWKFLTGFGLFLSGGAVNIRSDQILRRLRNSSRLYGIPRGFLFEYVSCPNYLGEIIEWLGWAMLTWSLAGLSFALWTIANLLPRAIYWHRWYRNTFENYPSNRKALVPFVL